MKMRFAIPVLLTAVAYGAVNDAGFARYQTILDKQPFGKEPPEADLVQGAAAQSFAKDLRLSMLFEGPDGTVRAGIVDNSTQKNYILRIGEPQESFELVKADIEESEAMVRKNNQMVLLKLVAGQPDKKAQPAARAPTFSDRRRALLQKIEDKKQPQEPPVPELTGEELRKHLEEVQMDAIRTGKPPLPMQLTPEMDAQLVAEGVLPPQ